MLVSVEVLLMQSWKGEKCSQADIERICNHYGAEHNFTTDTLSAQFQCVKHIRDSADGDEATVKEIIERIGKSVLNKMIPEVVTLIRLYLTCTATTATAQRSFSHLCRLKTYLRSTMTQRRLNSLIILNMYQEDVDNLDLTKLGNEFISKNDMRRKVFSLK